MKCPICDMKHVNMYRHLTTHSKMDLVNTILAWHERYRIPMECFRL